MIETKNEVRWTDEELMYWYNHITKQKPHYQTEADYCRENGIKRKDYANAKFRIIYKKENNPELYEKLKPHALAYLESNISASKYGKINNVDGRFVSEMACHLKIEKRINELLNKQQPKMNFIQIAGNPPIPKQMQQTIPQEPEVEIMEPKNDIELKITKGVKVIVSSDLSADKIIKIIELLKDL